MNQRRTILVGAALSVALTAGTACSSAVNGSGSGSSGGSNAPVASAPALGTTVIAAPTPATTGTSEPGSVGSSAPAPISASTSRVVGSSTSAPGGGVSTLPKAKAPATPAAKSTPAPSAPTSPPVIDSFNSTITDHTGCAVNGNVVVTLSWTSSSATQAYIAPSETATPFDAKGATSATGPLAPNSSTQVSFPCAESYYYFDLSVHNAIGQQYESSQIANPYAPSS